MHVILSRTLAVLFCLTGGVCLAQDNGNKPLPQGKVLLDTGFSFYTGTTGVHDSSTGWSTVMDSGIRYDFNRIVGIQLGLPYYISHNGFNSNVVVRGKTNPPLVATYNSLGDLYLNLFLSAPGSAVGYRATVTATAPTGDTSTGISTGRPTFDLNNHFEHSWGFFTPLAEFGIGDSSALINKRVRRPFTTLGPVSHFRAGGGFDFLKFFNFEASAYENLPIGNQKVFSHLFRRTVVLTRRGERQRFRRVRVDTGEGILEDNGLIGTLTVGLGSHVSLNGTYQRSLRQSLDIAEIGISFHFGPSRQVDTQ